jgi:predicted lipid-binding transport protein (Tim44 family)
MSFLPKPSSPRAAWYDLVTFVRQREREHVIGATLAFLVTLIIVLIFLIDPKVNTAPPEQVTYAELYPSNRTDAEIIADQKKDAAARLAAKQEKQRQFKALENQLGM